MRTNKNNYKIFQPDDDSLLNTGYSSLDMCRRTLVKIPFFTMMLHRKGYAKVQINFEEYYITENTQIIMLSHSTINILEASSDFEIIYICFRPSDLIKVGIKIDNNVLKVIKGKPCYHHSAERFAIITSISELILKFNSEKDNEYRNRITNNLLQIIFLDMTDKIKRLVDEDCWEDKYSGRHDEIFKKFMWLIHNHCLKEREVKFYANELSITPRYLATIVKDITHNKTAKQIIDENVIAEIKYLLESTDMHIKELVEHMNFPDASFLGKYFKKHTGMTIMEYKK